MPIFEYKCNSCGHKFERLVFGNRKDDNGAVCPACGRDSVSRLISGFSALSNGKSIGGSSCGPCSGGSCATCH